MRFATLPDGTPDGRLHVVSRGNTRCTPTKDAGTLQQGVKGCDSLRARLEEEYQRLNSGGGDPLIMPEHWHRCHGHGHGLTALLSTRTVSLWMRRLASRPSVSPASH